MATARSKVVVLLVHSWFCCRFIVLCTSLVYFYLFFFFFLRGGGGLYWCLFWFALFNVLSSFEIILTRKRELVALLSLSLDVLLL